MERSSWKMFDSNGHFGIARWFLCLRANWNIVEVIEQIIYRSSGYDDNDSKDASKSKQEKEGRLVKSITRPIII